jgi:hypothetical protein
MSRRIAVCEADILTPQRDAGSRAVADIVAALRSLGDVVELFAETSGRLPAEVAEFAPDVVIVSRPGLFARLQPLLAPLGAPLVYLAHDLHFVRVGLQQEVAGTATAGAVRVLRLVEERCFAMADLVLLPTAEEVARAAVEFPGARCVAVPYFAMPAHPPIPAPPPAGVAFVGGHRHAPNLDGVTWFAAEVWPPYRTRHPEARLDVFGDWATAERPTAPGLGYREGLPDAELDAALRSARVGIAPLRFGAGMKRKTLHYLSLGLPVVGTRFAVQGLGDGLGEVPGVLLAESPEQWTAALERLDDDAEWQRAAEAGRGFVAERFSPSDQAIALSRAISRVH